MSLSSKVQLLVSGAMSRINNKANEVKTLNNELEYFIEQTRKEIESEERKLERERSELVQNEQNFNAFKNRA